MVLVKILGLFDVLAGISLILVKFGFNGLAILFSVYLILKGLVYIKDLISVADIICGVAVILAIYGYFNIFSWLVALWLLQKGIISLLS